MVRGFVSDCRGAAAAEYVLILAIIGAGIAAAAFYLASIEAAALRSTGDHAGTE